MSPENQIQNESSCFSITKKTSHQDLPSKINKHAVKMRLGEDILQNITEVNPDMDVNYLLSTMNIAYNGSLFTGMNILQNISATTIGNIAKVMEWNMDQPEVVYMSNYVLFYLLSENILKQEEKLHKIRLGEIIFLDDTKKQTQLETYNQNRRQFIPYQNFLSRNLTGYAGTTGLIDKQYLFILEQLAISPARNFPWGNRTEILCLLKQRKIEKAYTLIKTTKLVAGLQ